MILPKVTWVHIPECLALGEWSYHNDYLGHGDFFFFFLVQFFFVFLPRPLNIFCFCRFIQFLFFIEPIFAWNVPLVSLMFLKKSLVFPILCFPLFLCSGHWGKLSYLSSLWFGTLHSNGYIFLFLLCYSPLFSTAICKASSDSYFAFLHFFFLRIV